MDVIYILRKPRGNNNVNYHWYVISSLYASTVCPGNNEMLSVIFLNRLCTSSQRVLSVFRYFPKAL